MRFRRRIYVPFRRGDHGGHPGWCRRGLPNDWRSANILETIRSWSIGSDPFISTSIKHDTPDDDEDCQGEDEDRSGNLSKRYQNEGYYENDESHSYEHFGALQTAPIEFRRIILSHGFFGLD